MPSASDAGSEGESVADGQEEDEQIANKSFAGSMDSESEEEDDPGSYNQASSPASSVIEGEQDQEALAQYSPGGYHPVKIGDVIDGRYHIVRKIGFGHFSTVWLTWDSKTPPHDPHFKALKISKSDRTFTQAIKTEISILKDIAEADDGHEYYKFVCGILDNFSVESIHGKHVCMVTHCHGENLLQLIRRGDHKGLPEANVKRVTKQMLQGLHYLHDICGILHTDIKPENILVEVSPIRLKKMAMEAIDLHKKGQPMPPDFIGTHESVAVQVQSSSDGNAPSTANVIKRQVNWKFPDDMIKAILELEHNEPDPALEVCDFNIKITDFGNACYIDHHFTDMIQTLPYRAIEVVIQAGYGPPADVWSAACVAFEIATGDYLFDGMVGDRFATTEDHLTHIVELLGDVPKDVLKQGKARRKYFTLQGQLKTNHPPRFWFLIDVLIEKYKWQQEKAEAFSSLLLQMLDYDQDKRSTAEEAFKHSYLEI